MEFKLIIFTQNIINIIKKSKNFFEKIIIIKTSIIIMT